MITRALAEKILGIVRNPETINEHQYEMAQELLREAMVIECGTCPKQNAEHWYCADCCDKEATEAYTRAAEVARKLAARDGHIIAAAIERLGEEK